MKRRISIAGRQIEVLFPITLFLIFGISALCLILFAARSYQRTVERGQASYNTRTAMAYITEKVHHSLEADCIEITSLPDNGDIKALLLTGKADKDAADQRSVQTYLYEYDDYLYELTSLEGVTLSAASGTKVMPLKDLSFTNVSDHLLKIACSDLHGNETVGYVQIL